MAGQVKHGDLRDAPPVVYMRPVVRKKDGDWTVFVGIGAPYGGGVIYACASWQDAITQAWRCVR